MFNDGNDPHLALWLAEVPEDDLPPAKPRPLIFLVVLLLLLATGLICARLAV